MAIHGELIALEGSAAWLTGVGSEVVLTTAHLDHDATNSSDANLKAMCQACHLRLDSEQHGVNAHYTRERKKGQLQLFGAEDFIGPGVNDGESIENRTERSDE